MLNDTNRTEMLGGILRDEGNYCTGNFRGFNLRLQQTGENAYRLQLPVCSANDPDRANLNGWLNQLRQLNPAIVTDAGTQYHCAAVGFLADGQEALKQNTENIMGSLANFLAAGGYQSCCEVCGQPRPDVAPGFYQGAPVFMCAGCAGSLTTDAAKAASEPKSSNLLLGTLGALVGALAGGIVWFLLGRLGVIAGIAGYAMAFLAILLYGKLGGTVDRKGVIVCLIATFGMVWLSNRLSWTYEVWSALKSYGFTLKDSFVRMREVLKANDLMINYYKDLVVGVLFTVFSTYRTFISAFAGAKKN